MVLHCISLIIGNMSQEDGVELVKVQNEDCIMLLFSGH